MVFFHHLLHTGVFVGNVRHVLWTAYPAYSPTYGVKAPMEKSS